MKENTLSSKSHLQLRIDSTTTLPCNSFCIRFEETADITVLRKSDVEKSFTLEFSCEVEETPPNRINDFFYAQLHFKTSVNNDDQSAILPTKDHVFYLVCPIWEVQMSGCRTVDFAHPVLIICHVTWILLACFSDCKQIWVMPVCSHQC